CWRPDALSQRQRDGGLDDGLQASGHPGFGLSRGETPDGNVQHLNLRIDRAAADDEEREKRQEERGKEQQAARKQEATETGGDELIRVAESPPATGGPCPVG
ncbi:MAG: hypothetical protein M3Q71_24825, partial [Chloroflexota bacterium]|nr:hypothetical protein [Chloroflexota bacterium]